MDAKTQRAFRTALLSGAGAALLAGYAFYVEPRWLEVRRTRIQIYGLPAQLQGLRIALLSDLHAGKGTPLSLLRRACRLAMREKPDVIGLTGDFVCDESVVSPEQAVGALSQLRAPLGVFAVPGNHDHAWGIRAWKQALKDYRNVVDLTNKSLVHEIAGVRLGVAGVDDLVTGSPNYRWLNWLDRCDFVLLLAHNPDHAEEIRKLPVHVNLTLSGHTHAGQVRLPLFGALLNPSTHDGIYDEGLVRRPWTQVYISRGVGTIHLPVRFLCRPEISILELTRQATPEPEPNAG
ncbi:MAG TPA: metallophosphoesterase [Rhodothermales bacterium]|nr:metallophosphoesterase [Rhodothermales bacterium]